MDGVCLFQGNLLDTDSLIRAMEGCDRVFHTAAFAGVWSKDPGMVFRLNVEGSLKVCEAARVCKVRRMVITSTAGILGPSNQEPVDEDSPPPSSFFTSYEKSKFILEQKLKELMSTPPELVIVNPTRVFGPGYLSESNGVTKMIRQYVEGNWRFIPGNGKRLGNYVFVEDVVTGHLLAMENGVNGERYILGGENISYNQLFHLVREISGVRKRLFKIPLWIMLTAAGGMLFISKLSGRAPLIVPELVRKFNHNWNVSSGKAVEQLNYKPLTAREGIERTIHWIKQINQIQIP